MNTKSRKVIGNYPKLEVARAHLFLNYLSKIIWLRIAINRN